MYRLNRLNSANHLLTAAAAYPKRSVRLNPPLRPFLFTRFSGRPPTPAGIDDSVNVSKGDQIAGEGENQNPINEDKIEYERKVLPPELHSRNVVMFTCDSTAPGGICDVYLIGTVHFSTKSSQEVRDVIKFLQPQIAFLELCDSRSHALDLDGGEFVVADTEARKYGGKVILGDRPIDITLKRAWAKTPLRHKSVLVPSFLLYAILSSSAIFRKRAGDWAEECDDDSKREADLHFYSHFPTFWEALGHERDQYMSAKLLAIARKHNSVVAVVGKAHLAGIRKRTGNNLSIWRNLFARLLS